MVEDGRKNNGGKREGSGRPKKVTEELANTRILKALKNLYHKNQDEDNVNSFLIEFIPTERGQMFIAQHLLGKPKETIETKVEVSDKSVTISFDDIEALNKNSTD